LDKDLGIFNTKTVKLEVKDVYEEGAVVREVLRRIGRFLGLNIWMRRRNAR